MENSKLMKKKYFLNCEGFQVHDGKLWFVSGNFLCFRNLITEEVGIETYIIPQYGSKGHFLSSLTGRYENRMICIPEFSDRIVDYDVKTKKRRDIIVGDIGCGNGIGFRSCCLIDGKIYIMPQSAKMILVYDPEHESLSILSSWYDEIIKQCHASVCKMNNLFSISRQIDKNIYFCTTFSNLLCRFDPQNESLICTHVGPSDYKYQVFYFLNGVFYLIDNAKQRIICWSEKEGVIGQIQGIPFMAKMPENSTAEEMEYRFFDAFNYGKKIFFPACFAEESIMIDTQKGSVTICEALSEMNGCCYVGNYNKKRKIITSVWDSRMLIIDEDLNIDEVQLVLTEDEKKIGDICCFSIPFSQKKDGNEPIWRESNEKSLEGFINYIG